MRRGRYGTQPRMDTNMKKLIALFVLCLALTAKAEDISPVVWVHTNSGTEIFVSCFWASQFSDRDDLEEKHLIIAVRKDTWQDLDNLKQAVIRTAIGKLLRGEVRLTKAKMQEWRELLADNNIRFALTSDPRGDLMAAGLMPKGWDEPLP